METNAISNNRFLIREVEGDFELAFSDFKSYDSEFEQFGIKSNSDNWEILFIQYLENKNDEIIDFIDFDSTEEEFIFTSEDLSTLKKAGKLLDRLLNNKPLILRTIKSVDLDEWE